MVHALEEVSRVLKADGVLVDLRPLAAQWPIEVVSASSSHQVGRVSDLPQGLADDAAANEAMRHGEEAGLFVRQVEETFTFSYTWDSPAEMQEYIEAEWSDFVEVRAEVWRAAKAAWAVANADARVGIRAKMLITRWGTPA